MGLLRLFRRGERRGDARVQREHLAEGATLARSGEIGSQQGSQRGGDVGLFHIAVLAWLNARPCQHERLAQHYFFVAAVPADVDLPVVAHHQHRVLGQVELRQDLTQQGVRTGRGGIPVRVLRPALVVPGVIDLVQVDESELLPASAQPGQGCVHHLAVRAAVLQRRVKAGVHRRLGDQLLEPVVA